MAETADNKDNEDPTREGLDHLQAAAREMIAAARSFLDAAEDLVDDPKAAEAVFDTLGSVVRTAARRARFPRPHPGPSGDEQNEGDGEGESRVERIRLR
jgi:hypothetical protein